ncbi:hypothetical protein VNO77_08476 [Canavalia gladiata]|uniref:Uncharacterized protein n=1 Tax=Canavalia gladiata TaxID=3824 RepID=A0AAN9QTT7_CANGL
MIVLHEVATNTNEQRSESLHVKYHARRAEIDSGFVHACTPSPLPYSSETVLVIEGILLIRPMTSINMGSQTLNSAACIRSQNRGFRPSDDVVDTQLLLKLMPIVATTKREAQLNGSAHGPWLSSFKLNTHACLLISNLRMPSLMDDDESKFSPVREDGARMQWAPPSHT